MSIRLLVLAPFAPRIDAPHGGRATASLLRRLAANHDVALVCIRGVDEPPCDEELRKLCSVVEEVVVERPAPGALSRRLRHLAKPVWGYPNIVARAAASGFEERVRTVAEAWHPDVVHVELIETARYLDAVEGSAAPRLLVDHDPGASAANDWSQTASGVRRLWRRLDRIAWNRYLRSVAARIDGIVVLTERDREAVEQAAPGVRTRTIPLSVELPSQPLDPVGDSRTLLFFGGYEHPPNADAALRLERTIYPALRERHPDVTLELVGDRPTQEMQRLAGDGISLTGRVESLLPYLDRAALVVAPIRLGGGMRVKVLETLAAGKALVASRRALQGLELTNGGHVLVAEEDDEFVEAASGLLADPSRRESLARAARRWAETSLSWEAIVAAYETFYGELLEGRE